MPLSNELKTDRLGAKWRFRLLSSLLFLSGCTSLGGQPRSAWQTLDPEAPLGAQDLARTRKFPELSPESTTPLTPGDSSPTPVYPAPGRREAAKGQPELARTPPPVIPKIEFDDDASGSGLELSVEAPARKQVGSHVRYRVTIRNASDRPASEVAVLCQFDEPLVFTGSDKRSVVQKFERLLPGEAKELALSLHSSEIGSHCCHFSVTADSQSSPSPAATKSVCVEFVSRQLQIDMVGPAQRTEGSRAEFTFTLTNHSTRTLNDLKASLAYDKALVPREASAGKEARPGGLSWNLGTLQPLESISLQVDFECQSVARRACVALEVFAEQISSEHDEACLEILPVPGTLDLQISDRDDPVEVGKTGRYEVTVRNIGLQAARKLTLEATLPEQFELVSVRVLSGGEELRLGSQRDQARLSFDAIEDLAADGRITWLIEVKAVASGTAELRAQLTSSLSSTPITASEPTVVVEP